MSNPNGSNPTHGLSGSREYGIWKGMKQRCNKVKCVAYISYGAVGIKVCARWNLFENFYADIGGCPKGLSLDRINSKRGYSLENCRWASEEAQKRNTSRSKRGYVNGVMYESLRHAEQEPEIGYRTVERRCSGYVNSSGNFMPSRPNHWAESVY